MVLPFIVMSCGNSITDQLKQEMQKIKNQCPQYMGNGLTMTDANFYEIEKVLEFITSIEGMESLDASMVEEMKKAIVESFSSDVSAFEKFSVNTISKTYDYRFRYIYTDTEGNKLCEIEITKYDL